jgi:hypothetical protein
MYSNISFRDAYLKIYENLNESSTLADATKKASQSPTAFSSGVSLSPSPSAASTYKLKPSASSTLADATKKASQSPTAFSSGVSSSSTSAKSEPSASSPEASKPSPFKSAKELSDLRSASARATMAGPSKEAQELMSPRTKRILSGKSVYNNLPGRENMVSRNIERAKSSETPSPSTTPSTSSTTTPTTTPSVDKKEPTGTEAPSKPTPRVVQTSTATSRQPRSSTAPSTATSRQPRSSTTYFRPSVSIGYRGRTKKVSNINTIVQQGDGNRRNRIRQGGKNVGKRINKEAFEFWVNNLLGEGYDLSEYTWDDMYEMYVSEERRDPRGRPASGPMNVYGGEGTPSPDPEGDDNISRMDRAQRRVNRTKPPAMGRAADALNTKYSARQKGLEHGGEEGPGPKAPKRSGRKGRGANTDRGSGNAAKRRMKEDYDVFDCILEYLVAEGYADTEESALVIMANMSEEWRESIVEGFPNVRNQPRPGDAGTSGLKMIQTQGGQRGYINKHSGGEILPSGTVDKIMGGNLMVKNGTKKNTNSNIA